MNYPYENLSPEDFQHFCQALLTKEYPGVQCLPVGQPDGGRDALAYSMATGRRSLPSLIFQVKFVRNIQGAINALDWVKEIVAKEKKKILRLVTLGADRYVLMTNLPGTAHLTNGTIDKVHAYLASELPIHTSCIWRDDLNRRLDSTWDLKWAYPQLFTGSDLLRLYIEGGLSEDRQRRSLAIRTFVANQFRLDKEVKFKQIELQNNLFDLFIDIPIDNHRIYRHGTTTQQSFIPDELYSTLTYEDVLESIDHGYFATTEEGRISRRAIGAATLLLNSKAPKLLLLEGAPGQGKSTIAQYVCQVHRIRLLGELQDLQLLSPEHQASPLRLPLKVDLRDFATWRSGKSPFSLKPDDSPPQIARSLEGFLAALIQHNSGGSRFDVADLQAIIGVSAVLLVLDGLDEVAEIKLRKDVIEEIECGIDRLASISASLRVVVTSRPAAFSNSPGLSEGKVTSVSLGYVTPELIDEYASKWLKAKHLPPRESREVKVILKEKLEFPHLRDLARNPMQLAILLSLIHTRGSSLPDKRTALYDNYIDLFFNREAEKSPIVRDHRDLLIDIHRYLAWLLQTEAELGNNSHLSGLANGAIEESRLKQVLRQYLSDEGRDPELADVLFCGVVERVVAIVSRLQGTYEFEVQPLREYFAARFLYETAPYSPPGNERRGSKPDRFACISRNFYWLNVTRFYAGCYSKGELPSLIDGLRELVEDPDYALLSHPRVLAFTLLGDWVFSQHPRSVTQVVQLLFDGPRSRLLFATNFHGTARTQPFVLPTDCGRKDLIKRCLALLRELPPRDYAFEILALLNDNSDYSEVFPEWRKNVLAAEGARRNEWLLYGGFLGLLSRIKQESLVQLLGKSIVDYETLQIVMTSRRLDVLESSADYFNRTLLAILDRGIVVNARLPSRGALGRIGQYLNPSRYALAFDEQGEISLGEALAKYTHPVNEDEVPSINLEYGQLCSDFIRVPEALEKETTERRATDLQLWDQVVQASTRLFGLHWSACHMACVAAGIKSSVERCTEFSELFDERQSLCRRARYARLRAGNSTWWETQFNRASSSKDQMFALELWFSWASGKTITDTVQRADHLLRKLSSSDWTVLFDSVEQALTLTTKQSGTREIDLRMSTLASDLTARTYALLYLRCKSSIADQIFSHHLADYEGSDRRILKICLKGATWALFKNDRRSNYLKTLALIARAYQNGQLPPVRLDARHRSMRLNGAIAREIAENATRYPSILIAAAEFSLRAETARRIKMVAQVAESERWFLDT